MKIAVASDDTKVTGHFGHCKNFNIYDTEHQEIIKSESVENPGHRPGFLPNFLNDLGVNVIIAGGMGAGAMELFQEKGIETILGAEGDAKSAVEAYLKGELVSNEDACRHDHHGHDHHDHDHDHQYHHHS